MTKPVIPRALARIDVNDSIDHYRTEGGPDLASGFVDALERGYGHIGSSPASGSPRYAHELNISDLRSWPLRRFPYLIFYLDGADHVDVWRVLRAERDIPAWLAGPEGGSGV